MRRANSLPKFRWPIIACRKHRFHPLKSVFFKSTSQQVNELVGGFRIFEISSFRGFDFFDGGGEGVKKSRKEAGWGASFLLGDLFEVIFFFFSLKWFPLF